MIEQWNSIIRERICLWLITRPYLDKRTYTKSKIDNNMNRGWLALYCMENDFFRKHGIVDKSIFKINMTDFIYCCITWPQKSRRRLWYTTSGHPSEHWPCLILPVACVMKASKIKGRIYFTEPFRKKPFHTVDTNLCA